MRWFVVVAVALTVIVGRTDGYVLTGLPTPHIPVCDAPPAARTPCASEACQWRLPARLQSRCRAACVVAPDAGCRLRFALAHMLIGQPHAHAILPAAVDAWTPADEGALVLFFAGDHGTGKSTAAALLAEALFVRSAAKRAPDAPDAGLRALPDGVLKVDGWSIKLRPAADGAHPPRAAIDAVIERVHADVLAHLRACPRALVLFDELHRVHPDVIRSLARFTETPYVMDAGERVATAGAVFVFISDFGKESLTANDSFDELTARVRSLVAAVYGDSATDGVDVNRMFTYAIPFLPLDAPALEAIAGIHFAELVKHPALVERGVVDVVADVSVRAYVVRKALDTTLRESRYGRAVREAVRDHILLRLLASLPLPASEGHGLSLTDSAPNAALASLSAWLFPPPTPQLYVHLSGGLRPGDDIFIETFTAYAAFCDATAPTRAALAAERVDRRLLASHPTHVHDL